METKPDWPPSKAGQGGAAFGDALGGGAAWSVGGVSWMPSGIAREGGWSSWNEAPL